MKCQNCQSEQNSNFKFCTNCGAELSVKVNQTTTITEENVMKEYKVLTQKDRFFAGKFDPEKLENAINSYASEGWRVIAATTASIPSLGGSREELIVVLEREK